MRLSDDRDYRNFWLEILASDDFQSIHTMLFDLFCATRRVGDDPEAILQVQVDACSHILTLEGLKTKYAKEGNKIMAAFTNHMRLIVKHILDALVWRIFKYDRVRIQLLS